MRLFISILCVASFAMLPVTLAAQSDFIPPTDSRDFLQPQDGEHVFGAELGAIIFGSAEPDCNRLQFRVATESGGILDHFENRSSENIMAGSIRQAVRLCRMNPEETLRATVSVEQFGVPIAQVDLSGTVFPADLSARVTALAPALPAPIPEYDAYWNAYPRYRPDVDRFAELAHLGYSDFAYALGVSYDWQGFRLPIYFGYAPFEPALQIDRALMDLAVRSGHPTAAYIDTRAIIAGATDAQLDNPATLPENDLLTLSLRIAQGSAAGHSWAISYAQYLENRGVDMSAARDLVARLGTTVTVEDLRNAPPSDAPPTALFAARVLNEALVLDRCGPGTNFLELIARDDAPELTWLMSALPVFERRNNGCAVRVLTSAVSLSVRSVEDLNCSGGASGYTCTMQYRVNCVAFNPWASQNPTAGLTAAADLSLCVPIELESYGLSARFQREGTQWALTEAQRINR